MTVVPYATRATEADDVKDLSVETIDLADNAVTTNKIDNSAVTAGKIAEGQVVKSINNLKDHIVLQAGKNVSIKTKGADTLAIEVAGVQDFKVSLDDAYNNGSEGAGRTIFANNGAVQITQGGLITSKLAIASFVYDDFKKENLVVWTSKGGGFG